MGEEHPDGVQCDGEEVAEEHDGVLLDAAELERSAIMRGAEGTASGVPRKQCDRFPDAVAAELEVLEAACAQDVEERI